MPSLIENPVANVPPSMCVDVLFKSHWEEDGDAMPDLNYATIITPGSRYTLLLTHQFIFPRRDPKEEVYFLMNHLSYCKEHKEAGVSEGDLLTSGMDS